MEAKRPICGILSVALPPLGLLIAALVSLITVEPPRVVVIGIVIFSLSTCLGGLVFAICGFIRRERLRWLPLIGLALSICLGLSHFSA